MFTDIPKHVMTTADTLMPMSTVLADKHVHIMHEIVPSDSLDTPDMQVDSHATAITLFRVSIASGPCSR